MLLFCLCIPVAHVYASTPLTREEQTWLESRNNTITILPERNSPPFSYNDIDLNAQGIFIDYTSLVAKKLGVHTVYLGTRTRADIISALKESNNDYIGNLGFDKAIQLSLLHTEPYMTIPVVIAVRNDYPVHGGARLKDFNYKRIAVIDDSAIDRFITDKYPNIILERVIDNELALQKVALLEVDGTVMNAMSLQYYLTKQSLSSIKVGGTVDGLNIRLAFTVSKNNTVLNSILQKGLAQVTPQEHESILQKWQNDPLPKKNVNTFFMNVRKFFGAETIYPIVVFIVGSLTLLFFRRRKQPFQFLGKKRAINELKDEVTELEDVSRKLVTELEDIKDLEKDIQEKIKKLE